MAHRGWHTTCVNCDAHTPTASDRSAHIVYALYGPSHGRHLEVWNRTWLSGKKFVYVPDAPKGPFAANFRGVHAREKRGASNPASRYRFISDANSVASDTQLALLSPLPLPLPILILPSLLLQSALLSDVSISARSFASADNVFATP